MKNKKNALLPLTLNAESQKLKMELAKLELARLRLKNKKPKRVK
jgi:hypothetical protein